MDERKVHQYLYGASVGGITDPSDNGGDGGDPDDEEPKPTSLNAMTVAEIKALAEDKGYRITATKKADIIEEFLAQED